MLFRSCRFAANNTKFKPFFIHYGTRENGYVVGHTSHKNEASPTDKGRAEDTGLYYRFEFTPRLGEDFSLTVEIYGGYGPQQREAHFHLGDHSHYKTMKYTLDLSAYVGAGYVVSQRPRFYLHAEDVGHGELCSRREVKDDLLEPTTATPAGVYAWDLKDIRKATVDIVWDVAIVGVGTSTRSASVTNQNTFE